MVSQEIVKIQFELHSWGKYNNTYTVIQQIDRQVDFIQLVEHQK